ncbi:MAG: hypothetical protein ABI295_01500 [Xanthomarina sp.]
MAKHLLFKDLTMLFLDGDGTLNHILNGLIVQTKVSLIENPVVII